nr:MAG: DNA pilot protein [Microvirus sp.]
MSLLGGLAGLAGSLWSSSATADSVAAQLAFQREAMQHRYQWTMQDLKKAGLNPMLAIGNMSSSAIPLGASAHFENPGTAAVQSASAVKAMQIAERQQHNQDIQAQSVVAVNDAQASKLQAETLNEYDKHSAGYWSSQVDFLGASAREKLENIQNMVAERKLIDQQVSESQSRIASLDQQIENMRKERDLIIANIRKAGVESVESASRAKYNQVSASLAKAEQALTIERLKTQRFQTIASDIDAQARRLGLAKSKEDNYWYTSPVGKTFNRLGNMIRNVSPFSFAK